MRLSTLQTKLDGSAVERNSLQRVRATLSGTDANDLLHWHYEDLAVADSAGPRGAFDGFDVLSRALVGYDYFQFNFGQEIDYIFGATV